MKATRIYEIDFLRMLALLCMVLFHFVFDLAFFFNWSINYQFGFWNYIRLMSVDLFLLVFGISATLSSKQYLRYGKILLIAAMISIVTFFVLPEQYIRFGILHLIGLAGLLYSSLPIKSAKGYLFLSVAVILVSYFKPYFVVEHSLFVGLDILPNNYSSVDHYPLLPWWSIILFGHAIGKMFYGQQSKSYFPRLAKYDKLFYPARHTLFIYIVHQPILLAILKIIL